MGDENFFKAGEGSRIGNLMGADPFSTTAGLGTASLVGGPIAQVYYSGRKIREEERKKKAELPILPKKQQAPAQSLIVQDASQVSRARQRRARAGTLIASASTGLSTGQSNKPILGG